MNRLFRTRTRTRKTDRTHTATRIWAGLVIMMMVVSLFSSLIKPVMAAPDAGKEQEQRAAQPLDTDADGVTDDVDNCPAVANPDQTDTNANGVGDACDVPQMMDTDGDGVTDDVDNCPDVSNPDQTDSDGNGIGDACDVPQPLDTDGDGVTDDVDNCPAISNPDQLDTDNNGTGDACAEQEASSITVNYRLCPQGTDLSAADATTLSGACTIAGSGTSFDLAGVSADIETQTTGAAPSSVTFTNVPADNMNLTQLLPPAGGVAIFCEGNTSHGNTQPYARMSLVGTSGIFMEVLAGENIACDWYAMVEAPISDYTVTVYKWECEPGTMSGQSLEYYQGGLPDQDTGPCETEQAGIDFILLDGNGSTPFVSEINGVQVEGIVPDASGNFTITEQIPTGYSEPFRYCLPLDPPPESGVELPAWQSGGMGSSVTVEPIASETDYHCWFYNVPYQDSTVTIRKWECPENLTPEKTPNWYQMNCMTPMDGVQFTLTDSMGPRSLSTTSGQVEWIDVKEGPISIAETVPPGYNPQPYVVCGWTAFTDGAVVDAFPQPVNTINGVLNTSINYSGTSYFCDWYNQYAGPGEITVYKYTCPEGYDWNAWGADPTKDCPQLTNGVTYVLDQPDPGVDLQTDTGDSINGAVYFGGLAPGTYSLMEMVPDGIVDVFVWDCVGIKTSSVHPKPLSVSSKLDFTIAGGDRIECYWFNVPMPRNGSMLVKKFDCTTQTYVSDVNCTTHTTGQQFDLQVWNGTTWANVQSGTTDLAGQVTLPNLEPGDYRLVEPGKMACLVKSSSITPGNNIGVAAGALTTVQVYNCGTATKPPPTTPTKFPNTGAGPDAEIRTGQGIAILGLIGLAGSASVSRRSFLKRAAIGVAAIGGGSVVGPRALASQTLVPLDATVTPQSTTGSTPVAAECLYPATPSAATPADGTPVACARGAVPMHITIESIGVDYPIEYLEIIEGEMVQPTGAENIAWYKETARLGEKGNGLYAGHLNWWNMPEGPFFLLQTLVEGDVVEIEGDDDATYRYIVQWAQDFPIDEEPPDEALGTSDDEVITLVTCGGEWDAAVALYDHRTLVRAIRDSEYVPSSTPAA